jgi:Putative lactococcus lactis phage r1t holin
MGAMTKWWKDVGERTMATAVQAGLAVVFVAVMDKKDLNIDWKATLSIAVVAACAAFWKGYAAQFRGDPNSASLIKDVTSGDKP